MTRTRGRARSRSGPWGVAVVLGVTGLLGFTPWRSGTELVAATVTDSGAGATTAAVTAAAVTTAPVSAAPVSAAPSSGAAAPGQPSADGTATGSPASGATATGPGTTTPTVPATTGSPAGAPSTVTGPTTVPTATTVPDPSATAGNPSATDPGASATAGPSPSPAPGPSATPTLTGSVSVDHSMLALIPQPGAQPDYLAADTAADGIAAWTTVRVRFQLRNGTAAAVTVVPQLESRALPSGAFAVVPAQPDLAAPLHLDREWQPIAGETGTRLGPENEPIVVPGLRFDDVRTGESTVAGNHDLVQNPDAGITLPSGSVTEEEFTVRVSDAAALRTGYALRLTDAGKPLVGKGIATLTTGDRPAEQLSPGQRTGTPVGEPRPAPPGTATGPAGTRGGTVAVTGTAASATVAGAPRFALNPVATTGSVLRARTTAAAAAPAAAAATGTGLHGPFAQDADQCSACHSAHSGKGPNLLRVAGAQSSLCFTCHDGTGAPQDVKSQYGTAVPANNPATGAYYSHDALVPSTHTLGSENEFGGVSNRHSECGDCHNSHRARGSAGQQTAAGWTASGRLAGVSGVSVVNGAAGTAPTYTFLDGTTSPVTLEYQLCFKCHSGFTTLPGTGTLPPSRYPLDKGVELNPANASFHPVEAAGTNQTAKMAASLSGTSPYKLWNFTTASTVRCTHCHAAGIATGGTTAADGDLSPHTSANQGILVRPYRDQVLKSPGEAYAAADFALCYTCHAESPFASSSTTASSFRYHNKHVRGIGGEGGSGTNIDTPGAGGGNALCAECHYRIHGTSLAYGTQKVSGSRLVNFAPNVTANNGVLSWTSTATGGTCTLTCHGERHSAFRY